MRKYILASGLIALALVSAGKQQRGERSCYRKHYGKRDRAGKGCGEHGRKRCGDRVTEHSGDRYGDAEYIGNGVDKCFVWQGGRQL